MKINVVDQIMGAGKTSAAINYINSLPDDAKIMFVTPYNNKESSTKTNEVQRIIDSCPGKHFKEPSEAPRKIDDIKDLLKRGCNIATTHALFSLFDKEINELCYSQGYILFMDEVANVVEPYKHMSSQDLQMLVNDGYASINEKTRLIEWNDDKEYNGKFTRERTMCRNGCLAVYGDFISLILFPVRIFESFVESYILTYMFDAQLQKYYYDLNNMEYNYMYVTGDSVENYRFTDTKPAKCIPADYSKLIHIIDNDKLNRIGELDHTLSKTWYKNHGSDKNKKADALMKTLQKNTCNFYINLVPERRTDNNLWTTFKDYKNDVKGKGYTKGFLSSNARATNEFSNCHNVAYLINKYINPVLKNFFIYNGVQVDDDGYALSEMLQFIWRSAIRNNEEIYIYIPSKRMRTLLENWIKENALDAAD